MHAPLLLVGPQRAGSTLLRELINLHPQISVPRHTEIEIAAEFLWRHGRRDVDVAWYIARITRSTRFRDSNKRIDPRLSFMELVSSFLRQSREHARKPIVGATVHVHFDQLARLWPDARYVYLTRDPRPVADSVVTIGWASNHWSGAAQWETCERQLARLVRSIPDQVLRIRYEELVSDTDGVLGAVFAFTGAEPVASPIKELADRAGVRPHTERVDAWRKELDAYQVGLVEARVGTLMETVGYRLSTSPIAPFGPVASSLLELDQRFARLRLDVARYGVRRVARHRLLGAMRRPAVERVAEEMNVIRRGGPERERLVARSLLPHGWPAISTREGGSG